MTLLSGELERPTRLPKSGPRGTGYLIRRLVNQKGDESPVEEFHVTLDGSPISVAIPAYCETFSTYSVVANPYPKSGLAREAISIHKRMYAKTVTLSDQFFDEDMKPFYKGSNFEVQAITTPRKSDFLAEEDIQKSNNRLYFSLGVIFCLSLFCLVIFA